MRRRRKSAQSSSLDLFLDTICNAFGGIMFLSILIAILAQLRGNPSSTPAEVTVISRSQADEFINRIESLEQERLIIVATIETLELQSIAEDQLAVLELQQKIKASRARLEQATAEQVQASKNLSDVQLKVQDVRNEMEELDEKLLESKAAIAEKSKATDEALDAHEQKMELPSVRATSKSNLLFAMRYGKVYLVTDIYGSGIGGFYSKHVLEKKAGQSVRIAPRRDAGWDMDNTKEVDEFKLIISNHPSSGTFLSCAVWPDSFAEFGKFKELLIELGYDYDLIPVDDVEDLPIGRGGAGTVQ